MWPSYSTGDLEAVKTLTHNSQKVYFLNFSYDFLFYYYGGYQQVGYFNPLGAWPYMNDLSVFLQDLLDKDYYLVTNTPQALYELLPKLKYNRVVEKDVFTVYSKEKTSMLLPVDDNQLVHMATGEPLAKAGVMMPKVQFENTFTIELLVKPGATQVQNAMLLANTISSEERRGFMLLKNSYGENQYLFTYADFKDWVTSAMFTIEPNTWNYLVLTGTWNNMRVYNNGKLVATKQNGPTLKNSTDPLMIGNIFGQNLQFNGWIREVKISKTEMTEDAVVKTTEELSTKLQ
jgi:hypothetical protein